MNTVIRLILYGVLPAIHFLFWFRSATHSLSTSRCPGKMDEKASIGSVIIHQTSTSKSKPYVKYQGNMREEPELCDDDDESKSNQGRIPSAVGGIGGNTGELKMPGINPKAAGGSRRLKGRHCADSGGMASQDVMSVLTSEFDKYRNERMGSMSYATTDTLVLLPSEKPVTEGTAYVLGENTDRMSPGMTKVNKECSEFDHHWVGTITPNTCFAVAKVSNLDISPAVHRFDDTADQNNREKNYRFDPHHPQKVAFTGNKHNTDHERPIGFFRKIPKERGFQRITDKLGTFVANYEGPHGIASQLDAKLKLHGVKAGDDVVIMVVNEGEIDLFMNFACSCQQHKISLSNVIVFAASQEIVPMIESTGAIGLFHVGYASVSKKASNDYLDRVFVDMMWYKAFCVHLIASRGINLLFQDADLVWFRDPFPYFKKYREQAHERSVASGSFPDAFFSDDGQRSLRYSPFFANSGFYYMIGGPKSAYMAWSIMTAFDAVQVLGSHQNVFTYKMVEGLGLNHRHAVILDLKEFPNGIMYHHDKRYMRRLDKKEVSPYGFHMCWTQGKPDKLKYLKLAKMWYLTEQCTPLDAYIGRGGVISNMRRFYALPSVRSAQKTIKEKQEVLWDRMGSLCCTSVEGAP